MSDSQLLKQLDRIEYKLDQVTRALSTMIDALAMEEEGEPEFDLDGQRIPSERQEGQPL